MAEGASVAQVGVAVVLVTALVQLVSCDQDYYLSPGVTFVHVLNRAYYKRFFPPHTEDRDDPIIFHTNRQGYPDRPGWLHYLQRSAHDNGMLYGTPTGQNVGKTVLEVIAYNRRTFDTIQHALVFHILPSNVTLPFQAEFYIRNMNVEEVLPSNVLGDFLGAVKAIWQPGHNLRLHALNVSSALDRGGRVPLPLAGKKEGVYVLVGSDMRFSSRLLEPLNLENKLRCSQESQPAISYDRKFGAQFNVDWCKFTLRDLSQGHKGSAIDRSPFGHNADWQFPGIGHYKPPRPSLHQRDFRSEFVLTMAAPAILAFFLAILLSYAMCCRREGMDHVMQQCRARDMGQELCPCPEQYETTRQLAALTGFSTTGGQGSLERGHLTLDYDSYSAAVMQAQQNPNATSFYGTAAYSGKKETSFITCLPQQEGPAHQHPPVRNSYVK
uniref:epsilon-sarcoglycan-like n=1 Tax=Myxine glutinosa TaxID=7769 RepID=UPI00358E3F21